MPIKISIITSSYNRAHTLHRAFNSFQKQTLQNFEWIILDDGSTDNTAEVVEQFKKTSIFSIEYLKQENMHKFITFFKGVNLAKGKYIMLADSDDSYPDNTIEILYNEIISLPKDKKYCGVAGLSKDINGKILGEKFPYSPLDSSYFDMRYKYKVKGEQSSLAVKEAYGKINTGFLEYQNKGFIPESIINYKLDYLGYKMRFINAIVRTYIVDESDEISLANSFYSDKNAFGLCENYKTFITCYRDKFLKYPKVYFKNFIAYILFGLKDNRSLKELLNIKGFFIKLLIITFYPGVFLFKNKTVRG